MKKQLFLSTSFSGKVNPETHEVHPEFRKSVEEIIAALRGLGLFRVFCAIEHEGWKMSDAPAKIGVVKDREQIRRSQLVVVLLSAGEISAGLHHELGYADALNKRVIMATEPGVKLPYFDQGVADSEQIRHVQHVQYQDPASLAEEVAAVATGNNLLQTIGQWVTRPFAH